MKRGIPIAAGAVLVLAAAAGALWAHYAPTVVLEQARHAALERLGSMLEAEEVATSLRSVRMNGVRLQREGSAEPIEIAELELIPSVQHALMGQARFEGLHVRGVRLGPRALEAAANDGETGSGQDASGPTANETLSATFHRLRTLADLLAGGGVVEIEDARFDLADGERPLIAETIRLQRIPGGLRAHGRVTDGEGRASWDFDLDPEALRATGELTVGDFPLTKVARLVPGLPWHDERAARLDGRLAIRELEPGSPVAVEGRLAVRHLWLASERLAQEPVGPVDLELRGRGTWDLGENVVEIAEGRVALNGAEIGLTGRVRPSLERYLVDLEASLPQTSCDRAFGVIPAAVLGRFSAFAWRGSMSGTGKLSVDAGNLDATEFRVRLDNRCEFVDAPREVDLARFRGPFRHTAPAANDGSIVFRTGPGTEPWTPLEQVSPFLVHAVLAHEDAGFFRHPGFAQYAIEDALEKNLERGRFAFGASTISMQLAKNLFLTRDKTLARKAREIVLTWWLEENLSKQEILELYLNVIEYGPSLYGIRPATRHYFDCEPAELTLAQAVYLATVLPAPARYDRNNFARGELSPRTRGEIEFLLRHMASKGRIADEARDAALSELDAFAFARRPWVWRPGMTAELPVRSSWGGAG